MDFIYRILGWVARASEGMARSRVNGLGLNWWIMFAVGLFTFFAGYEMYESLHNRGAARDVTVAQAVADQALRDTFVRVAGGHFDVEGALSQGEKPDDDGPIWVPMVDADQKHAMYVKLEKGIDRSDMSRDGIRGMLRSLPIELKDHVAAKGLKAEGVRMDTGVMLVAGERPARLWLWLTLTSIGALIVLSMLLVIVKRYVVFRRGTTTDLPSDIPAVDPANICLRVSGKFRLDERVRQRFLDTPAIVAEMESGDRGLLAHVNASVSMYGHVTENRQGVWGILIKSGTLEPPQYGTMYAGSTPRPAMRLCFTDAATGKRSSAVLSFATPDGRDSVRAALYAPPATEGATENTEDTEREA
jgi:hypothetical protein